MHGGRLPGERSLSRDLGVSRSTVRAALAVLEAEGVVRRESGRAGGTFALRPNVNWPLASEAFENRITPIVERPTGPGQNLAVPAMLRAQGFVAETRVIDARPAEATAQLADQLGVAVGHPIAIIDRVRLADGRPLSWESMHVSRERFPGLLEQDLTGSLWELFEGCYGVGFDRITERIEIVLADRPYASALEVSLGQPMLQVTRLALDADGAVIEYSVDIFRGDRTRLLVQPVPATGSSD